MPPGVYDKDGFKLGPNGGIFADPTANLTDNRDFESWDWKQIRAAVVGYSAAPASAVPTSTPFADPDSIRNASVVFNRARAALQHVSDNVRLQTEALAGENGAWKSPASEAFRSMNLLFAAKLEAKAEQINGGEFVGTNNVPAQLWNSGNYLEWAQEAIKAIDVAYADYVRSIGVTMGNGLARISDYPELVTQLGEDMKKIVRVLAQQYTMNTNSVTPPNPSDFGAGPQPPGTGGNQPPPNLQDIPPPPGGSGGGGGGGNPPPNVDIPPPPGGEGGGSGGGGGGGGNLPPPPNLNLAGPPGTGGGSGGGGGGGGAGNIPPPPSVNVPPPPGSGGGGPGGGSNGGAGNIPPPPSVNIPPPPGSGGPGGGNNGANGNLPKPPALNVPPPPGSSGNNGGSNGGNNLPKPPSVNVPPPPGSTGGNNGGTGNIPKPPALSVPPPPGSEGGTGNLPKPPGVNVPPPPGSEGGSNTGTDIPKPPPLNIDGPPGSNTGTDKGGAVPPPPMVPPPSGMGGGPGGTGSDRPDSSGLLGGVKKPWEAGSPPPLGDPGGIKPPVTKPEDWAAPPSQGSSGGNGSQVPPPQAPMMPPPSGMGGQPGGSNAERPDSSGLLGGEKKPWEGVKPPALDLSQVPPPVSGPEDWAAPPAGSGNGTSVQVPPGAPMMPPPSGMGGQPGGSNAERPDSSGLLGGEKEPWEGVKPPALDLSELPPPPVSGPEDWATGGDKDGAMPPGVVLPPGVQVPPGAGVPPGAQGSSGVKVPAVDLANPPGTSGLLPATDLANPQGTPAVSQPGQQVPAGGMPPMMPPGAGAPPGTGADRPDSSGLLGGINEPWTGAGDAGKVGGTSDVSVSATPESWALTHTDPEPEIVDPVIPGEEIGALPGEPAEPVAEPVAEVDLTPAAAPAGWAASSDVVPAVQEGPSVAQTAAVLGASAVTAAAVLATTTPRATDFPHVDADGKVKDDDKAGALVLAGGATGPLPGVDSVVVVRPDEAAQDTSAWDTGGMDFLLPGLTMPLVVARSDKSGWDTEEPKSEVELDETPLWEPEPALATYRRRKAGEEGPTVVDSFVTDLSCGDEFTVPPDQRDEWLAAEAERAERLERGEEDDEDAEEEERSAADLLNESDSAWGGSKAVKPTGVLE
uniref:hypothetical protein n=1 Tax=Lentzea sp. NPDC051838 TaxID=3154849 RepID=UPI00343A2030